MASRNAAAIVASIVGCQLVNVFAWDNGVALTPPMGFANWNLFGCNYDDAFFREIADAFVSTGLAAVGYEYMLVQECIVPAGSRDPLTHVPIPDPIKFPHGLADLAAYFHSKGLKAGIYTDVAHLTCAGYEGSGPGPTNPDGHWPVDALWYAQQGFDMIEADFCNTGGVNETAYQLYKGARDAIAAATAATGREIAFYQCNWGNGDPWLWFPEVANLARNTGDICSPGSIHFNRILYNFDNTVIHSSTPPASPGLPGTGIGAWNDPDMLGVGMPGITDTEGRTQFSLWCVLSAPLFLGTDVRNMSAVTLATLSNAEAIAINQDPLGIQAYEVATSSGPVPFESGLMYNLTAPPAPGVAPAPGTSWFLQTDGHISNTNSSNCITTYACGNSAGTVIFGYDCVTDQCNNQLWKFDSASGTITTQVTPIPSIPLCLTAVDPDTDPFSTVILDTCDGRGAQGWIWGKDGTLCIPTAFASVVCLAELMPSNLNLYARPLAAASPPGGGQSSTGFGVAVLNRGPTDALGYFIDLSLFGFAPAETVMVRDIWAGTTLGPFARNFTTRPLASHETILMRIGVVNSQESVYSNPVLAMDFPDPTALRTPDGAFYAYATVGNGHIYQVANSSDLVQWTYLGEAMPDRPSWADTTPGFSWAPDVGYHNNSEAAKGSGYYMYFAMKHQAGYMCIGVAFSSLPGGPFVDARIDKTTGDSSPLLCGQQFEVIDPKAFDDPVTGNMYLYYGSDFSPLSAVQLSPNRTGLAEGTVPVVLINTSGAAPYESLVEGSWIHYVSGQAGQPGTYYYFYSGDSCCGAGAVYAVMLASGPTALGPFTKLGSTLSTHDSSILTALVNSSLPIIAPGHNSIVTDDAGTDWIVYHGYTVKTGGVNGPRTLNIDKLVYVDLGSGLGVWPVLATAGNTQGEPSSTPQQVPVVNTE